MLGIIQFPVSDLRDFASELSNRLKRPGWPAPQIDTEYIRSFGAVRERPRGGLNGWIGEASVCHAVNAIRYEDTTIFPRDSSLAKRGRSVFRRFYFDGIAVGKLEIGISVKRQHPSLDSDNKPAPLDFVKQLLSIRFKRITRTGRMPAITANAFPNHLRSIYYRSTTQLNADEDNSIYWIETGRPAIYIEFFTGEFRAPRNSFHYTSGLVPFRTFQIYYWSESHLGTTYPVWAVEINPISTTPEEVRVLRVTLLRLHAENQTLSHVLKAISLGRLNPGNRNEVSDRLQSYLTATLRKISKLERTSERVAGDHLGDLAHEIGDLARPGERDMLLHRLAQWSPRPSVAKAVTKAVDEFIRQKSFTNNFYVIGGNMTQNKYEVSGLAGNVGPDGHVSGNVFNQQRIELTTDNIKAFEAELPILLSTLKSRANDSDKTIDVSMVDASLKAVEQNDTATAKSYLKRCSHWVLEVAQETGASLTAELLKSILMS